MDFANFLRHYNSAKLCICYITPLEFLEYMLNWLLIDWHELLLIMVIDSFVFFLKTILLLLGMGCE